MKMNFQINMILDTEIGAITSLDIIKDGIDRTEIIAEDVDRRITIGTACDSIANELINRLW